MTTIAAPNTPLKGPTLENKIHTAAKAFVGTFLAQMVEEMFKETSESDDESSFEKEMYTSYLAKGMADKLAESGSAKDMMRHVENKIRRQSGLDDIKTETPAKANNAYAGMTKLLSSTMKIKETAHVCAPTA